MAATGQDAFRDFFKHLDLNLTNLENGDVQTASMLSTADAHRKAERAFHSLGFDMAVVDSGDVEALAGVLWRSLEKGRLPPFFRPSNTFVRSVKACVRSVGPSATESAPRTETPPPAALGPSAPETKEAKSGTPHRRGMQLRKPSEQPTETAARPPPESAATTAVNDALMTVCAVAGVHAVKLLLESVTEAPASTEVCSLSATALQLIESLHLPQAPHVEVPVAEASAVIEEEEKFDPSQGDPDDYVFEADSSESDSDEDQDGTRSGSAAPEAITAQVSVDEVEQKIVWLCQELWEADVLGSPHVWAIFGETAMDTATAIVQVLRLCANHDVLFLSPERPSQLEGLRESALRLLRDLMQLHPTTLPQQLLPICLSNIIACPYFSGTPPAGARGVKLTPADNQAAAYLCHLLGSSNHASPLGSFVCHFTSTHLQWLVDCCIAACKDVSRSARSLASARGDGGGGDRTQMSEAAVELSESFSQLCRRLDPFCTLLQFCMLRQPATPSHGSTRGRLDDSVAVATRRGLFRTLTKTLTAVVPGGTALCHEHELRTPRLLLLAGCCVSPGVGTSLLRSQKFTAEIRKALFAQRFPGELVLWCFVFDVVVPVATPALSGHILRAVSPEPPALSTGSAARTTADRKSTARDDGWHAIGLSTCHSLLQASTLLEEAKSQSSAPVSPEMGRAFSELQSVTIQLALWLAAGTEAGHAHTGPERTAKRDLRSVVCAPTMQATAKWRDLAKRLVEVTSTAHGRISTTLREMQRQQKPAKSTPAGPQLDLGDVRDQQNTSAPALRYLEQRKRIVWNLHKAAKVLLGGRPKKAD